MNDLIPGWVISSSEMIAAIGALIASAELAYMRSEYHDHGILSARVTPLSNSGSAAPNIPVACSGLD